MVSTATPPVWANCSIRYSTSKHCNGWRERSRSQPTLLAAGAAVGRAVAQRGVQLGVGVVPQRRQRDLVPRVVQLEHAAQGLAVVERGAVDLLDDVAVPDARLLGWRARHRP